MEMLELIRDMPLASVGDLAAVSGLSSTTISRRLRKLEDRGQVEGMSMGWTRRAAQRWRVTEAGLADLRGSWGFNTKGGIVRLTERLAVVENCYLLVGLLARRHGRVLEFQWHRQRSAFDAVVRFEGGWGVLIWSGFYNTGTRLRKKMEALNDELREVAITRGGARPGVVCVLVRDAWQAELARRAAAACGLAGRCLFYSVNGGHAEGLWDLSSSAGWVAPRRIWYDGRVDRARGVMEGHPVHLIPLALRLLDWIEEWPGVNVRSLARMTGWSWQKVRGSLNALEDKGLIQESGGTWFLTEAGITLGCRRDGAALRWARRRFGMDKMISEQQGARRRHEHGLLRLMAGFGEAGCDIAVGHRAGDYGLAAESGDGRTAIVPDGVVYLTEGPYGRGWHYVEYELRCQSPSSVVKKLRPYRGVNRQDDYPAVFVCRNERAERLFWELGSDVAMVTSTAELARKGALVGEGAAGRGSAWRKFGEGVVLGS